MHLLCVCFAFKNKKKVGINNLLSDGSTDNTRSILIAKDFDKCILREILKLAVLIDDLFSSSAL